MFENLGKKEKKVEYIELVYDLIFVYIISRNNSLLHNFENGFVNPYSFIAYILCTLAVIQIWNFSTFYINMFGKNGVREHIFIFVNMFLLYFIGQATREEWQAFQSQYHIAWGLILVNCGVQYLIELKNHRENLCNKAFIKRICLAIFVEAACVFVAAIPNPLLGTIMTAVAIISGIAITAIGRKKNASVQVDFAHLTERAMLYVVFTFGEMIIAVASYFTGDGGFDITTIYFALGAFLIVVALFLSYGFVYDYLIDREGSFNGMPYMIIHIFIIFSLNNITACLEFMREEEIKLLPKILFMTVSLIAFFVFLLALKKYEKSNCAPNKAFIIKLAALTAAFVGLMLLLKTNMHLNILISVIYVFSVFIILYMNYRALISKNE